MKYLATINNHVCNEDDDLQTLVDRLTALPPNRIAYDVAIWKTSKIVRVVRFKTDGAVKVFTPD